MVAKLEGPIFGPYRCSNCKMGQPNKNLKSNCIFCGNLFTNYEDIIIEEDKERFLLNIKEGDKNEGNL